MIKYIISRPDVNGEMEVQCATIKVKLGTLHLNNGKYRYAPVTTGIEVGEYSKIVKQHRSEQLVLVKQAA